MKNGCGLLRMYNERLALFRQCQHSERKDMDKKKKVIRMIMVIAGEITKSLKCLLW